MLEAAKAAIQGQHLEVILTELADLRKRTYLYAVVDTLEFLRRSGRVARYRAILGSMVKIKPIITFHDGVIKMEMAVTTTKAFKRIAKLSPVWRLWNAFHLSTHWRYPKWTSCRNCLVLLSPVHPNP